MRKREEERQRKAKLVPKECTDTDAVKVKVRDVRGVGSVRGLSVIRTRRYYLCKFFHL